MSDSIRLSDLTEEQRAALKAEILSNEPQIKAAAEEIQSDDFWITNPENCEFIVPDIGYGSGNNFNPLVIAPYGSRDLREVFSMREINKSHYLKKALAADPPQLLRGKIEKDRLVKEGSPLDRLIVQNSGTDAPFRDPTSGTKKNQPGTGYYDDKLKGVFQREHQEDLDTRQGLAE